MISFLFQRENVGQNNFKDFDDFCVYRKLQVKGDSKVKLDHVQNCATQLATSDTFGLISGKPSILCWEVIYLLSRPETIAVKNDKTSISNNYSIYSCYHSYYCAVQEICLTPTIQISHYLGIRECRNKCLSYHLGRKIGEKKNRQIWDILGGLVVKHLPANARDTGSVSGPGKSHMPWHNWVQVPQHWACAQEPMSCNYWSPQALEPMLCRGRSHHKEKPRYCS